MARLPRLRCDEVKKAFERADFTQVRQSGSHCILNKEGHARLLSIPMHKGQTLGPGLLKSLIENAGLTVEEFQALL